MAGPAEPEASAPAQAPAEEPTPSQPSSQTADPGAPKAPSEAPRSQSPSDEDGSSREADPLKEIEEVAHKTKAWIEHSASEAKDGFRNLASTVTFGLSSFFAQLDPAHDERQPTKADEVRPRPLRQGRAIHLPGLPGLHAPSPPCLLPGGQTRVRGPSFRLASCRRQPRQGSAGTAPPAPGCSCRTTRRCGRSCPWERLRRCWSPSPAACSKSTVHPTTPSRRTAW